MVGFIIDSIKILYFDCHYVEEDILILFYRAEFSLLFPFFNYFWGPLSRDDDYSGSW